MSDARARYGRQVRLPEIGEAGQERLLAREVALASSTDDAREIETAYLHGAGMKLRDAAAKPPSARPAAAAKARVDALGLRDPAARDVAEGALAALLAMRAALGIGEPG